MKQFKSVLFSMLLVCSAFIAVTYTACTKEPKNPCAQIMCLNGGACNQGTCVCPSGFEGIFCEKTIPPPPDPCDGIICQNGGACVDGTCNCPAGYEGVHCETKVNQKFLGVYTAAEPGYSPYPVIIVADPVSPTQVLVKNLGNYMCSTGSEMIWNATVSGAGLTINDVQCSTHMTATLHYSASGSTVTLSGSYSATYGPVTDNMNVVLTKN